MKQLISDETKVKKLKQNPTKSREDSLLTYLLKLRKDGIFDDVTFKRYFHAVLLVVSSTVFPRFTSLVALFALLFPLLTLITT